MTKPFIVYYTTEDDNIRFYDGIAIKEADRTPFDTYNCFEFLKYLDE